MTIASGQTATAADVLGKFVSKTGDAMSGPLSLAQDPVLPMQAATKQYVDTRGGTFVPLAGGTMTGNLDAPVLSTGSSFARKITDRFSDRVNVMDFGAKGDGTTNDTAAFQAAIATGKTVFIPKPASSYRINDALTCATQGQIIEGDGKGSTIITIDASFNMSALGVFVVTSGVPGPNFRDFQINFVQPDTSALSSLTTYPPAFYAQNQPRTVWRGVKVNAATNAIDIRQNAGGCSIIDCELCAFENHILIDGSLDSITVENTRFENDLLTTNQSVIYRSNAVGISSGRCDDLHVNGCLFICYTDLHLFQSQSGLTFGEVTNTDFDTTIGMRMSAGTLQISGSTFTVADAQNSAILLAGGSLTLSSCWLLAGAALANGMIVASPAAGSSATLQISNCRFDCTGDMFAIQCFGVSGNCEVIVTGSRFGLDGTIVSRVYPTVYMNNGTLLTMNACRFSAKTTGSGHVLVTTEDVAHNICGNSFGGWDSVIVAGSNHVFANNN